MYLLLIFVSAVWLAVKNVAVIPPRTSVRTLLDKSSQQLKKFQLDLRRYRYNGYVDGLVSLLSALLLIAIVALAIAVLGLPVGLLIAGLLVLTQRWLKQLLLIEQLMHTVYSRYEPRILGFVERQQRYLKLSIKPTELYPASSLDSVAELESLIAESGATLSDQQRRSLLANLQASDTAIEQYFTVAGDVVSIGAHELLGPLLLDDLFKTKRDIFPVIKGDNDNIIGVIDIKELLTLRDHKTRRAESQMSPALSRVAAGTNLLAALRVLLRDHSILAVVQDQHGKTSGMISLYEIIEILLGDAANR